MNPCKCGYFPDRNRCRCTQKSITQYLNRISQPLLDRIDICVEAPRLEYEELIGTEEQNESSAEIRARVLKAHQVQMDRFAGTDIRFNSQIPSAKMSEFCSLGKKQEAYMKQMYKKLELSARSYHKIIKVARTIADLAGCEEIEMEHLNEAVCYRSLDRKFWER